MVQYTSEFIARFWLKVAVTDDPDQCWEWQASTTKDGYGHIGFNGTVLRSHRIAYTLVKGDPGSLFVLHQCDNRRCCNPAHLFLGTHLDNAQDKAAKGRGNQPQGEQHGACKLTAAQVWAIRQKFMLGSITKRELAADFHVSATHIGNIISGKVRRNC